jgi:hypothetical protein
MIFRLSRRERKRRHFSPGGSLRVPLSVGGSRADRGAARRAADSNDGSDPSPIRPNPPVAIVSRVRKDSDVSKYREQYERMKRRYRRFQEITSELPAELSGQSLTDDGLAFFESCLHLRDWIKNDEELPQTVRRAAFPYVEESRVLSLCHDIAIGAKHLIVTRPLARGENPRLSPIRTIEQRPAETFYGDSDDDVFLPPGTPVHVHGVRLVLETSGGEIGALLFAGDCIKEWDGFFKLHGLT